MKLKLLINLATDITNTTASINLINPDRPDLGRLELGRLLLLCMHEWLSMQRRDRVRVDGDGRVGACLNTHPHPRIHAFVQSSIRAHKNGTHLRGRSEGQCARESRTHTTQTQAHTHTHIKKYAPTKDP